MATVLSHALVAVAIGTIFPKSVVPRRIWLVAACCSVAPDIDVIGFRLGIRYEDLLGHRGLSHSLAFAAALSFLALVAAFPRRDPTAHRGLVWLYLLLVTASHGPLDAMTDGGLGVAFFAPFENARYFFPFRPIAVSPIGAAFFTSEGLHVLASESKWIWLPSCGLAAVAWLVRQCDPFHGFSDVKRT